MKTFCLVFSLYFAVLAVGADEARRVFVVDFTDFSENQRTSAVLGSVFSDSLALELARSGFQVLERRAHQRDFTLAYPTKSAPLDKASLLKFAASEGADAAVTGFYLVQGPRLTVGVKAYDVLSGRQALAFVDEGVVGSDVFDTIDQMASNLVPRIKTSLPPLTPSQIVVRTEKVKVEAPGSAQVTEKGIPITITLTGSPKDLEVYFGDLFLGNVGEKGLKVRTKKDASLALSLRAPGYHETHVVLDRLQPNQALDLGTPFKKSIWVPFGNTLVIPGPGVNLGVKYFFIPDVFSVEGFTDVYSTWANLSEGNWAYRFGAMTRIYAFPPDSYFRFNFGLGYQVGWILAPSKPFYASMAIGVGAALNLPGFSIEFNAKDYPSLLSNDVDGTLGVVSDDLLNIGLGVSWKF